MKTFHHGGRFGDCLYALWTMRELGGGKLIVSDFHQGNWSLEMAKTLKTFLEYQSFIDSVDFVPWNELGQHHVDYDLQQAENDYNPEAFPECDFSGGWPGSANIAKRYALHFGLTYRPSEKWLEAPPSPPFDPERNIVAMHVAEHRSIREWKDWLEIRSEFFKCGVDSIQLDAEHLIPWPNDWLITARMINAAKLFLGVVSGPHALAEGLGKTRLVEQAPDCFNVSVLPPSQCINGWSNQQVIERVRELL